MQILTALEELNVIETLSTGEVEEDKIIVLFDEVGYKALSLTVVQENNLLESLVSA